MKSYQLIYRDGYEVSAQADSHEIGELSVTLFVGGKPVVWAQQYELRCMLIKDA